MEYLSQEIVQVPQWNQFSDDIDVRVQQLIAFLDSNSNLSVNVDYALYIGYDIQKDNSENLHPDVDFLDNGWLPCYLEKINKWEQLEDQENYGDGGSPQCLVYRIENGLYRICVQEYTEDDVEEDHFDIDRNDLVLYLLSIINMVIYNNLGQKINPLS